MANTRRSLSVTLAGVPVSLRPLGDPSWNCWGLRTDKVNFLRQELVGDQAAAEGLLRVAKEFIGKDSPATIRLGVEQLGFPDTEWDQITAEHILLAWLASEHGLSLQLANLNIPTQPMYAPKGTLPKSEFHLREMAKLPKLQNSDAWETYCYWLHEEMERILETFHLESIEVYTLQALLLNFVHEVRASFLSNNEAEVTEALLKLGGVRHLLPIKSDADSLSLEKILFKRRREAREELAVQYETLEKIVPTITAIEANHRELVSFKWQASILKYLLGPQIDIPKAKPLCWIQMLILLQLFHGELGIVTCICSDLERSNAAFAVQVAVALMRQKSSLEQLLDMALLWKETARNIDQAFVEHGEHYAHGLQEREKRMERFREIVVEVMEHLCIPLTAMCGKLHDRTWLESQQENQEIVDLFPMKFVKIKGLDSPKRLTAAGHHFLSQLISD